MDKSHPYVIWAQKVIENYVKDKKRIKFDDTLPKEIFAKKRGCFVSIHKKDGQLRGCIGTIFPIYKNLIEEIQENAIAAATRDPRFPPVSPSELEDLVISVDILSDLEKVEDTKDLNPKVYGVVVKSGYKKGVLLPDIEGVDTVEEQLRIAKMKAGIYKDEPVEIYRFTVERYY
ncbi:MAG: AmmeMemoRadiSam system protein A [Defluviitoga tunisiensis]|jgi:AmmeMemoRadiSam system protein A|uniref:AMMECR1 domain-containing protein n=1 Tax=Defluviitoga tunisiensis TaxID=1006576 RepID=A0A0C7NM68_DEFTU|nr:AmmeMemoRadiSam system protein A [Defluviitoga tunisiensis]MDD3600864.1 AmmeMemoRadiSam system protein A [Defluviitoga tunisiensis]MDY0380021.1 AmmeMemoRadiSam system protein A [Defluviitoga tunisiensis]CEP78991.1 AMMECR1 domain-containing protein [Defluviitoga tunisiensis]HHV01067.1 AmmeMemoRadiSam system protein A [Defluviitoga tunisiensis]HOB55526.1 AmmeMemoRadiSam system protein A [Defluviitoga tunisiensis]